MSHIAVTAVGADRPGIVAGVTGVLFEQGCNLEDTSMTILRGHFAMMLIVAVPDGLATATLEDALRAAAPDLLVSVRPIEDDVAASPTGDPWAVSVYGADRPGIVYRVAGLLAERGVNIVDLSTRVIGSDERPVYAMLLDVTLPDGLEPASLDADLAALAADVGVECTQHPSDAAVL